MSSINSEYTQLINQFKNEISKISLETLNKLEQSISDLKSTQNITKDFVNDFENQINNILSDAQNHLINKQNAFYNIINSMSVSISSETEEIKNIIEQKKQEALLQLNKSENSAINRLEETYDIGVETILSAEKTALCNLSILTDELIQKIKNTTDSIDSEIKTKLEETLKEIEEFSESIKEEIKEIETIIKKEIKEEVTKVVEKVYEELANIKIDIQNFASILKKELSEYKELMLEDIRQDKEKFFIEIDREQNRILEVLRLKEYEIVITLNKKEQAIISNIAIVVAGYDRELEVLKQSKLNEFINSLEFIVNETIKNIINNAEEIFKSQVNRIIQEIEETIIIDTKDEVRKLLNEFSEQRYEVVLPAGMNVIELPKKEFTITNRLKLYLDGILQVRQKNYIIDSTKRTIILTRSFPDDIDVIVTEDIPNTNVKEQIDAEIQQLQNKTDESLLKIDEVKNQSVDEITGKIPQWIETIKIETRKNYEFYKKDFEKYVEQWKDGRYNALILANTQIVNVPTTKLKLNKTAKIYFDGILQIQDVHYTIDFLNNSITILKPFFETIDLTILQNISLSDIQEIQGRPATNEEIDNLFKTKE